MKATLQFDFSVDKANNSVNVLREFAAPRQRVWDAWTRSELLDQWWAPKPWRAKTKSQDFRPGGTWLYAMIGPENETHWSLAEYKNIDPIDSFSGLDAFCDEQGTINPEMPRSMWTVTFSDADDHTVVRIAIRYDRLEDLEKTMEMGFREGFTAGLQNLEAFLAGA